MAKNMPAIPAAAVLDDLTVRLTSEWGITPQEQSDILPSASGRRRKAYAWPGDEALPPVVTSRRFRLRWAHVGGQRSDIERRLARPGVHTLVLWRREDIAWPGNGQRREYLMPRGWTLATESVKVPDGLGAERFAPELRVGVAGEPLATSIVDVATYDGGDPAAGEAWITGSRIKLGSAVPVGEWLYASVVPIYQVFQASGGAEKALLNPSTEPLELELLEV